MLDSFTRPTVGFAHPTQKHYDQEVDFFKSFLDPYMKYSSGLWDEKNNNFERAAINMLDCIIDFMPNLSEANILEIGPGWGSFIRRSRDRNCGEIPRGYLAINPSTYQNRYLKREFGSGIEILESSFEEMPIDQLAGRFDYIIGLGSFCHLNNLDKIVPKLSLCLSETGKIIFEDTLYLSEDKYQKLNNHPETSFIQEEVFGTAPIPSLPNFLELCAASNLGVEYTLEHSDSYYRTISEWITRLSAHLATPNSPFKENAANNIRYMQVVQRGWEYTIGNYLIVLQKTRSRPRFIRHRRQVTGND